MKKAILIFGPQASGKGTQAKLLADRLGFFHFDTGDFIRKFIYDKKFNNDKEINKQQEERKLYEAGKLSDPEWVLKNVSEEIKKLSDLNESVVFSGSPRTMFEAFGDENHEGVFDLLVKEYGKENINIFYLDIPEEESIRRGMNRLICSVCKTPFIAGYLENETCPFCGGKVEKRTDDTKEGILERLKEFNERTKPIFKRAEAEGYKIIKISGAPMPYKIHEEIFSHIKE